MKRQVQLSLNIAIILIAVSLFIWAGMKAHFASFTHDESFTYNNYVSKSFMDILSFQFPSANNHLLNTLFMKFSESIFGNSEWALRLPNTLAHLLYLIFSYKLLKKVSPPLLLLPFFILLNANPYLLDFFSIARGYGLSIGFLMTSIYLLFKFLDNKNFKHFYLSLGILSLAVLSSFVLIYFFMGVIIAYNLFLLIGRKEMQLSLKKICFKNIFPLLITSVLALLLYEPIRKLTEAKQLYYGGSNGFFQDSIGQLLNNLLYYQYDSPILKTSLIYSLYFLVIVCFIYIFYHLLKKGNYRSISKLITAFTIFISIYLLSTLNHSFTDAKFMIGRTALFLYPLIILIFILLLSKLAQLKFGNWIAGLITIISTVLFSVHTYKSLDSHAFLDWSYDQNSKSVMKALKDDNFSIVKSTLGAHPLFAPASNYYRSRFNLTWLDKVSREGIDSTTKYNYLFGHKEDIQKLPTHNYELIIGYEESNSFLYKINY